MVGCEHCGVRRYLTPGSVIAMLVLPIVGMESGNVE
jgi:hypothetical protein